MDAVESKMLDDIKSCLPGYTVRSYEFVTRHKSVIHMTCPVGHDYTVFSTNILKNKSKCHFCHGSGKKKDGAPIKWNQSLVERKAEEHGYQVLSQFQSSKKRVLIKCPRGHEYEVVWISFATGKRCKKCLHTAGEDEKEKVYIELQSLGYSADLTHYETVNSRLQITCDHGHVYEGCMRSVRAGKRCPHCAKEKRKTSKALNISDIPAKMPGYKFLAFNTDLPPHLERLRAIRVACPIGHEYDMAIQAIGNHFCPICSYNYKGHFNTVTLDILCRYYATGYQVLSLVGSEIHRRVKFLCDQGHVFVSGWSQFTRGSRCPHCQSSSPEKEISEYLTSLGVSFVRHVRNIISPRELDFFIPSANVAIEYHGSYWHSDLEDVTYHQDKTTACRALGITLLSIYEHDFVHNKDAQLFRIRLLLGLVPKRNGSLSVAVSGNSLQVFHGGYPVLLARTSDKLCAPRLVHGENPADALSHLQGLGYVLAISGDFDFSMGSMGRPNLITAPDTVTSEWLDRTDRIIYDSGKFLYGQVNSGIGHQVLAKLFSDFEEDEVSEDTEISDYYLALEPYSPAIRHFIEKYEWMRSPGNPPKWCFVARWKGHMAGVVLLNTPQTYTSDMPKHLQCLIQRGASAPFAHKHLSSRLVGFATRWMTANTEKRVFVGYSDPRAGEIGTVYQACNFFFLGAKWGAKILYRHPSFKSGRAFSSQYLKRTSTLVSFCKSAGIEVEKSWFRQSGYKDMSKIPTEVSRLWKEWQKRIICESVEIEVPPKGKYALVTGRTKSERKRLQREFLAKNEVFEYPKRGRSEV